jgi:APA family basic amino acid/polyamine antiporter
VTTPPQAPTLVRAISRTDLTLAIVNAVVGSAIFGLPGEIAGLTGAWSPLAFVLAAFFLLAIVLCFAEVASRFDTAGGPYLYAREGFGPLVGFQAGWLTFWIRATAVAANLNVLIAYLATLVPAVGSGRARVATMALLLGAITALNIRGVKQTTRAIDALTVLKFLPALVLVAMALPRFDPAVASAQDPVRTDWAAALLLLVYGFGGFEAPLMAAGEAKDPRRDTGFALLAAIFIITSAYVLVQVALVGFLPQLGTRKTPIADAFSALLGPWGLAVASGAAVLSIGAWSVGTVLQTPRLIYGMAERGDLPATFARVHERFRTPWVAILAYSAVALALASWGSFVFNATLSGLTRLLTYGLTCAALPVLRRRGGEPAGFRVPMAGVVVTLALAFCVALLVSRPLDHWWVVPAFMVAGELLRRLNRARMLVVVALCLWTPAAGALAAEGPQVAITIDDLPWVSGPPPGETTSQALQRIAAVLRVHEAPATGFVVCERARRDEAAVRAWAAWRLGLGNHTESHLDLNRGPTADWLAGVASCDTWLKGLGVGHTPYFRFPYLHEGMTAEVRDAVKQELGGLALRNAPVSVDTSDWILARAYEKALAAGDGAARAALGRELVRHVADAVAHADGVARRKVGRPVPLVLLLHANALVADHLDAVLLELRRRGTRFVELQAALADPVYARRDEYAGRRGLSWLYRMEPLGEADASFDDAEATAIQARFPEGAPLAASRLVTQRLDPSAPRGLAAVVEQAGASERTRALLVMHRGRLVAEAYYNGADAELPQNLKSVTKTLASMLVGVALERGWIASIDDPVAKYLPERFADARHADKRGLTVRQLLTMSSGLAEADYDAIQAEGDWVGVLLRQPFRRSPGTYAYDTPVLSLLTAVLEKVSGLSSRELANRHLLGPLGGEVPHWRTDREGIAFGGNDAYVRPRDLVQLGELFRNGGRHGGRQVLGASYVRDSLAVQVRPADPTINHGTLPVRGYGYLWWLLDLGGEPAFAALGHGGQELVVVPGRELVVLLTSRWPGPSSTDHYHHLRRVLDAVVPLVPRTAG